MIIKCKLCGETMEHRKILEHAVIKHDDPDAKELLETLNNLSRRGT